MRVGVLLSAGGSAFHAAASKMDRARRNRLLVVTDRPCGAELKAQELAIELVRITLCRDRRSRSEAVAEVLAKGGAESCIVMYDKLVTADLFDKLPCVNIHPSSLPAYPGIDAVTRAFRAGEAYLGATAHLIDAGIDTGPVLGRRQNRMPIDLAAAEHVSFMQKASLAEDMFCVLMERDLPTKDWLIKRCPPSPSASDVGGVR